MSLYLVKQLKMLQCGIKIDVRFDFSLTNCRVLYKGEFLLLQLQLKL